MVSLLIAQTPLFHTILIRKEDCTYTSTDFPQGRFQPSTGESSVALFVMSFEFDTSSSDDVRDDVRYHELLRVVST